MYICKKLNEMQSRVESQKGDEEMKKDLKNPHTRRIKKEDTSSKIKIKEVTKMTGWVILSLQP